MTERARPYRAMVSSDWNECLAPCGPFDVIAFNYPEKASILKEIFGHYTSNTISLGEAANKIRSILPDPITIEQMDAYLDSSFVTYRGVPDLMEWCMHENILFMINTTGTIGYFQRVFAKGLIPQLPVVSAHPMIRYPDGKKDPVHICDLLEIEDKGKNTEAVGKSWHIPPQKTVLIGDSGGDGPHFEWGTRAGAFLIGSMTKPSLETYCQKKGLTVNHRFGISYHHGEKRNPEKEMNVDFTALSSVIGEIAAR